MQPLSPAVPRRVLRKRHVLTCTGLSDTTLWRMTKAGKFPKPIKLSTQCVGWFEDEVLAWQAAKAAEREDVSVRATSDVSASPAARV